MSKTQTKLSPPKRKMGRHLKDPALKRNDNFNIRLRNGMRDLWMAVAVKCDEDQTSLFHRLGITEATRLGVPVPDDLLAWLAGHLAE